MRARLAAAPGRPVSRPAAWTTCRMGGARSSKKKHFMLVKKMEKTFGEVARQPKWTPEAGLKPKKGFFLQHKMFFFTTMRARLAGAPGRPGSRPVAWTTCRRGVQEAVKKTFSVVKKNLFEGPQTA